MEQKPHTVSTSQGLVNGASFFRKTLSTYLVAHAPRWLGVVLILLLSSPSLAATMAWPWSRFGGESGITSDPLLACQEFWPVGSDVRQFVYIVATPDPTFYKCVTRPRPQVNFHHHYSNVRATCALTSTYNFVTAQCLPLAPPKTLGCSKDRGKSNPCDAGTGNKYQREQDIDAADGQLGLVRTYNSHFNGNLGFGPGWTSSVHKRLEIFGTNVTAQRADGRGYPFTCTASGCTATADVTLQLGRDATGYTLTQRNGARERYNVLGQVLSETDPLGRTTTYTLDSLGRLGVVTGPFGHKLTFGYHPVLTTLITSVTDSANRVTTYSYDAFWNARDVTYADGAIKRYHYEDSRFPTHLTGISYDNGAGAVTRFSTYAYDATGKAVRSEHAETDNAAPQERFTFSYDTANQTTVTDPVGVQERLTFATNLGDKNLLTQLNLSDSQTLTQSFDANNNLTCKKDEAGRVTTYTYNATNQRLSMTEGQSGDCTAPVATAATRTTSFQYLSPILSLPTVIATPSVAAGQTKATAMTYADPAHPTAPTQITQSGFTPAGLAVSRTIAMGYNAAGQVISIDGPRTDVSDVTAIVYNECSTGAGCAQLASVTNALGQSTTYNSYDANGRLTQMTDANGVVTGYSYDPRGRVIGITVSPPAGQGAARLTQYSYDHIGQLTQTILPDGVTLNYTYDAAQYLRSVTDNLGNKVEYGYDLKGNRTQTVTKDPAGTLVRQIDTAFDLRNRVAQVNAAGSLTQQLHDAVGNLVRETDPNQSASATPLNTTHGYDALNRLLQTVDNLSGQTLYAYDANDRLKQVTTPNSAATQYSYDDLGNLLSETSPDRGTRTYTHDTAGNVLTTTDARGIPVAYSYDALNRLSLSDYPGTAEDIAFVYDNGITCAFGLGRLCQVTDESGTTQYAYDPFGNTTEQRKTELGVTYITRYTYDAGNRIVSMIYPDGRLVSYTRDTLGRVIGVSTTDALGTTALASNIGYRADGLMTGLAFGNGITETRTYDLQGRLTQQTRGLEAMTYGYDANGNVTATTQLLGPSTFAYDALDRLSSETITGLPYQASYDANGNRLSVTAPGNTATLSYEPASNRLAGLTVNAIPEALSLDATGNLVSLRNGQATLTYNAANRLAQVTYLSAPLAAYTYNQAGLRTRKTTPLGSIVYHYDQTGQLLMESTDTGIPLRTYIWLDQTPLAQIDLTPTGPSLSYLHADHLNTPRAASNAAAAVIWRWAGEAFGSTDPLQDPDGDAVPTIINLRFPGQYFDEETGFFYNWNRYYDPRLGRYLTSDPIGLDGGFNTYAYVENNPLKYIDPEGLLGRCGMPGASCGPPPGVNLSGSVGGGVMAMGGTGGASASWGVIFGKDNVCFYQRYCGLVGMGFAAGGGAEVGGATGKLCSGDYRSAGGFAFAGGGWFGGGSLSSDGNNLDVGAGLFGGGAGEASGAMGCITRLSCTNPCDDDSCKQ